MKERTKAQENDTSISLKIMEKYLVLGNRDRELLKAKEENRERTF